MENHENKPSDEKAIKSFEELLLEIPEDELPVLSETKLNERLFNRILTRTRLKLGFTDDVPENSRRNFKLLQVAAVFAAIIAVFSVAIAAYNIIKSVSQREEELIDPSAEKIGVVQEQDGAEFTVDKAVRSGDDLFIYYTIKTPETTLDGDILTYDSLEFGTIDGGQFRLLKSSVGSAIAGEALCYIPKDACEINSVMLFTLNGYVSGDFSLRLKGLRSFNSDELDENGRNEKAISTYLSEKEFALDFTVGELDTLEETVLKPDSKVEVDGMKIRVSEVRITPLTIEVTFKEDDHDYSGAPLYEKLAYLLRTVDFPPKQYCTFDVGFYRDDGSAGYREDGYDPFKWYLGSFDNYAKKPEDEFSYKWYFRIPFYPEEIAGVARTKYLRGDDDELTWETQILWNN